MMVIYTYFSNFAENIMGNTTQEREKDDGITCISVSKISGEGTTN
jgi:hypothetical protein